jgi:CHAT domain-containing protein/tetratricopeptide (TPR) repeat protein
VPEPAAAIGLRRGWRSPWAPALGLLLSFLPLLAFGTGTPLSHRRGLIVDSADPGKSAASAGVRPGDILLDWVRTGAPPECPLLGAGEFASFWDWVALTQTRLPQDSIRLHGRRGTESWDADLEPGEIGITVRPPLPLGREAVLGDERSRRAAGDPASAGTDWEPALQSGEARRDPLLAAWLYWKMGAARAAVEDMPGAEAAYLAGLNLALEGASPVAECVLAEALARVYERRSALSRAEEMYRHAADRAYLAGGESPFFTGQLNSLFVVVHRQGRLEDADEIGARVLALSERLLPGSLVLARTLNNVGNLADDRGDTARALKMYLRSLDIKERLAPGKIEVASTLNNLGALSAAMGNLEAAEDYHRRALAIKEALAPGTPTVALSLNNLGTVLEGRGDLAGAQECMERSLAIRERLDPESLGLAMTLSNLADLVLQGGDLDRAEVLCRRSLAIRQAQAPGGLDEAESLMGLGQVFQKRGDLPASEEVVRRAVSIRRAMAPGSVREAEALHALGEIRRAAGDAEGASRLFEEAVAALDSQRGKLGASRDTEERVAANFADIYRDMVAIQVRLGRNEEAFLSLERFRARTLLAMLAERDLVFSSDAPHDLLRRQKDLGVAYDHAQEELGELSPGREPEKVEALLRRLREVRVQQEQVAVAITEASPHLASLQYPHPSGPAEASRILGRGTLLLSFCTGREEVTLLALLDGTLSSFSLPVSRTDLTRSVARFRALLAAGAAGRRDLDSAARRLFDRLLAPAGPQIRKARRIVICPDGPLHILPFGALSPREGRYWVEDKPLSFALSATILGELAREEAGPDPTGTLEGFGDPLLAEVRAIPGTAGLSPLPGAREELEAIAALFPASRVHFGEEATEEAAKSVGRDVRFLHFSCHGIPNERFPLDSGLLLTAAEPARDGRDNGLLQAWEILEQVRIDADLVTLSACESALGAEMGGEGLVGLTRAFQYAGARSVLSSLWSVSDTSTALLMKRLYAHIRRGIPRDEALRRAQIDLIRHRPAPATRRSPPDPRPPDWSHPFHWAAFVLNGDPGKREHAPREGRRSRPAGVQSPRRE